jgi:cupin 2 domain-containing protein
MIKVENMFRELDGKLLSGRPLKEVSMPLRGSQMGSQDVRIEAIRSVVPNNPPEGWYDQHDDELVMLVEGSAELEFQDGSRNEVVQMRKGDYVTIPAHLRHRVTKVEPETYWLAVFYK